MPPKGRKVKINVKQIMEKRLLQGIRQEGEQEQGEAQNQALNIVDANEQNSEKQARKEWKDNEGSKKNNNKEEVLQKRRMEVGSKKQISLKNLIKLATNQIYELRKELKFPAENLQQVCKQSHSLRLASLFQKIHNHYFIIFEVFKDNGLNRMDDFMKRFSSRLLSAMKDLKQNRISEMNSIKSITNEEYNQKLMLYYSMELKLKDDDIKRKKAFRQNAKNKYLSQIKQVQNFIIKNARIVSEAVLRERFQFTVDRIVIINNEVVAKKLGECDTDIKNVFREWRKIKKEKMMLDKLKRGQRVQRQENNRKILGSKFPNMMGVLLDPFTIFQKLRS